MQNWNQLSNPMKRDFGVRVSFDTLAEFLRRAPIVLLRLEGPYADEVHPSVGDYFSRMYKGSFAHGHFNAAEIPYPSWIQEYLPVTGAPAGFYLFRDGSFAS